MDGAGGEAAEVAGSVDGVAVTGVVKKESGEGISSGGEIFADAVGGGFGDENRAVFLTLAPDDKFATVEIDRVAIEADKLGDTKSTREEKLDDSAVAQTRFGIVGNGGEKVFDLVVMKESNLFFNGTGEVNKGGVERVDTATCEIFKEAAEGDEMISLSDGFQVVAGSVDF